MIKVNFINENYSTAAGNQKRDEKLSLSNHRSAEPVELFSADCEEIRQARREKILPFSSIF